MNRPPYHRAGTHAACIAVAVVLAMGACSPVGRSDQPKGQASSPSSPSPTPSQALVERTPFEIQAATIAAMRAVGFVRTGVSVKGQGATLTIVTDSGPDSGVQVFTAGSRRGEIRFVKETAYLQGNRGGLVDIFGFPESFAAEHSNEWISLTVADGGFAEITDALTMDSLITSFTLSGDLTTTDVMTIGRKQVIGIVGKQPLGSTATLYVATTGPPLLIRLVGTFEEEKATVDFSRWGVRFHVDAPSKATPVSEIE